MGRQKAEKGIGFLEDEILKGWERTGGDYALAAKAVRADLEEEVNK